MSNIYKQVLTILEKVDVPSDQAEKNFDRLLRTKGLTSDSITLEDISGLMNNLAGIVVLKGDKTKMDLAKSLFSDIK